MTNPEGRCRLVLVLPETSGAEECAKLVGDALRGGDVASVILPQYNLNDSAFQKLAERVVPVVQHAGAAALICGDSRVVGRVKADGIHIAGPASEIAEAIDRYADKLIVGGGNATDRHSALEVGEERPDYIFFGKLDGDIKPEAHPKNLVLAEWWASMIETPCIVMGGTDPASALEVAQTGAEFVALRLAVFREPASAAQAVASVNAVLDEKAPRFDA